MKCPNYWPSLPQASLLLSVFALLSFPIGIGDTWLHAALTFGCLLISGVAAWLVGMSQT